MKPLPEPLPSDDSIELRSKLLSLQLLNSIIQNSGEMFRSGEKFIWAIRQYLCLSLLKNGVSPIAAILQVCRCIPYTYCILCTYDRRDPPGMS